MEYIFIAATCHGVLDRIVKDARNLSPVVIAGDFNAWVVEWGSKETKKSGPTLLETFSVLDLTLFNDGEKPTFIRGEASSMIDFTFASSGLLKGNICWRVSNTCTMSNHCAIAWRFAKQRVGEPTTKETQVHRLESKRLRCRCHACLYEDG